MEFKPKRTAIEKARKKIQRKELDRTGGSPEDAVFHSKGYHKSFDGYVEVKRLDGNGRMKIQRIYVDNYYEPDEPRRARILRRAVYTLLHALAIFLWYRSATAAVAVNYLIVVNIFHAALFLSLLWGSYVLLFYILEPGRMTIGNYKSLHRPLTRANFITAALFAGNALAILAAAALLPEPVSSVLPHTICGAAASFLIGFGEKRLTYTVIDNDTPAPPDASPIKSHDISHF